MSETNTAEAKSASARRGLGRGLSALIPTSEGQMPTPEPARPAPQPSPEIADGSLIHVPLTRISLNPYQPRETFTSDSIEELASSIRVHGVLQPIVVRPKANGNYELVAGERRFRAATAAGLAEIPAVVREMNAKDALGVALIENIQRENLNAVEEARAYRRLIDEFGLTQAELALEVGKSQAAIGNALRLLALPNGVQEDLAAGKITEGHAKVILGLKDLTMQTALRREIVDKRLSVRESERRASAIRRGKYIPRGIKSEAPEPKPPATDIDIHAVESELSTMLGTGVRFKFMTPYRGRIEIDFYDPDQMEGVIQRLLDLRPTKS